MKKFALIGAAGYIAERHLRAIKETDNNLLVATDTFDVMGRMDSYFPMSDFFLDYEKFLAFCKQSKIDYTSICSPNYLHAKNILDAFENESHAICEKPLVLYPHEVEAIEKKEAATGKKVYNILQLRLHDTIVELKRKIEKNPDKIYDVDLTYITSRGKWYYKSWKGDIKKSGGVATNIGIHFFDMLTWIFGAVKENNVHLYEANKAAGYLELEKARVRWYLSLDYDDIPEAAKLKGMRTYRSIKVEGDEIEFSGGFTDLHTKTYQDILDGNGYGISDAKPCILLSHEIRNQKPDRTKGETHPFVGSTPMH